MTIYAKIMGGGIVLPKSALSGTLTLSQIGLPKRYVNGIFHHDSGGFARGSYGYVGVYTGGPDGSMSQQGLDNHQVRASVQ